MKSFMRYPRKWRLAVVCLTVLALAPLAVVRRGRAQMSSPSYTVTDLGTLGGAQSQAFGISACGRVVGDSWPSNSTSNHPFIWSNGQLTDLGTLGGGTGTALSLNGLSFVVGSSTTATGDTHAFIWPDNNGKITDIGALPGDNLSFASAINDGGQVVGGSVLFDQNNEVDRAFVWSSAAGMQAIPASGGISPVRADGINNAGSIVGVASTSGGFHAYLLSGGLGGTLIDLGTLGGTTSFAYHVNASGQVVGNAYLANGSSHAYVWHDDNSNNKTDPGEMKDLGTLGGANSIAYDINASGQAVGSSDTSGSGTHAFVWHDDNNNGVPDAGEMKDLNTLTAGSGWTLQEARAINDGGQIVGYGINNMGQTHAFLLTPNGFTPPACPTPTPAPSPSSITNVSGIGTYNSTASLTATLLTSGNFPVVGKTVSFTLNGNAVCTVNGTPACPTTDPNGLATLTGVSISGFNVGDTPPIVASFAGDASYAASTGAGTLVINKAASTTTVIAGNATYDGQPHGGTATVTGAGGLSQSLPVSYVGRNGTNYQSPTTAPTNAGDYTASASYGGDTNHTASSGSKDFTIVQASQTISFGALSNKTYGDIPFTVSATGGASSSPVTFSAAGNCTSGGMNGSTVTITGAGSCTVTASQAGDSNYTAAANVQRSFQIAKASSATALSSSANPSGSGQSVTFTATVTSGAGTPTGTVTFNDGGGAIPNCSGVPLNSGQATCTTSALAVGAHTITAAYGGDSNFNPSSATLSGGETVGSVFEFAQSTYTVAENAGSVTINVRRTGFTANAASVGYFTDDGSVPSVAVPCSAVTGLALERCDYTRASGTLTWAAGDSSDKTFVVLVNDDSYNTEGTETTHLRLSNPAGGATLGPQSSATLQITDDAQQAANPVDDPSFFVRQHYHDFLNREPDAPGLQFWTGGITSCGADQNCVAVKRVDTSAAFFLSIEFQQTGYLVERIYKTAYGDFTGNSTLGGAHTLQVPVVRLSEFLADTQEVESTPAQVIVGQGNWQQQLEDNKNAFAAEFVTRPRFASAFPSSMTADAFVNQLNANAGNVLSDADRATLIGNLNNGTMTRAQALRQIAENPNLQQSEFDRAFVLMQYFGYLRRNPDDPPDHDYTGFDFWLQKLNQFNGNYINAQMVTAFITSTEYRQRFGQ
jgi:probable HAF family extracellular repeat protein